MIRPIYRFIIEGGGLELPLESGDGDEHFTTGFFTTRRARGLNREAALASVLGNLEREWSTHKPHLRVVDSWRVGLVEFRRRPNRGHVFFSDDVSRYAAASLAAEAVRAPRTAAIWQMAALDTSDDD